MMTTFISLIVLCFIVGSFSAPKTLEANGPIDLKLREDVQEGEIRDAFNALDKEKKGEINTDELHWILKSFGDDLTDDDIDDMILDVDTDGSGWVDYEEFYTLMTSNP